MTLPETDWRAELAAYIAREAKPVEKFGHQPRLYELTCRIGAGLAYDDDVVYAAVWMHDLGVFEGHRPQEKAALEAWDCCAYALRVAPKLLLGMGFPAEKIDAVLECIRTHQPQFEPTTIEGTILRDADILEQLGAIGILRTICKVGRDTRFARFSPAVAALRKALDTLPQLLQLPVAKDLAVERVRVLRAFLDAAEAEAGEHLH